MGLRVAEGLGVVEEGWVVEGLLRVAVESLSDSSRLVG